MKANLSIKLPTLCIYMLTHVYLYVRIIYSDNTLLIEFLGAISMIVPVAGEDYCDW